MNPESWHHDFWATAATLGPLILFAQLAVLSGAARRYVNEVFDTTKPPKMSTLYGLLRVVAATLIALAALTVTLQSVDALASRSDQYLGQTHGILDVAILAVFVQGGGLLIGAEWRFLRALRPGGAKRQPPTLDDTHPD